MNTFKTAVVLATLLGVGYGVHVVLNKPLNNNGTFQQNAQLPVDEFGLPNVQQAAQGIVGNAQGMINQAQGAVGQVVGNANQLVNQAGQALNGAQSTNDAFQMPEIVPPGGVADYRNQLTDVAQNAANNLSNQANSFVDRANNAIGQAQGAVDQARGMANDFAGQASNAVGNVTEQARGAFGQATNAANQLAANAQSQVQNGIDSARQAANDLSLNAEDFPDLPSLDEPAFSAPTNSYAQPANAPAFAAPQQNVAIQQNAAAQMNVTPQMNVASQQNVAAQNSFISPPTNSGVAQNRMTAVLPPQTTLPQTAPSQGYRPSSPSGASMGVSSKAFASMWRSAQEKINGGMPADALFTLSLWYSNPELSTEQRDSLIPMLDELAGKVIYSQEHHFGPPHTVQNGETLAQIATRYAITPEYIARVNGLEPTALLTPGQRLKVVTGPFRAELSRKHREITIFVGSYYAGRFSAGVGRDLPLGEMALEVAEKSGARPYVDRETTEQTVAGDPGNPYGNYWIGLRVPGAAVNPRVGLHSTGDRIESSDTRGCISLSDRDADDLQAILSLGSRFTIHR